MHAPYCNLSRRCADQEFLWYGVYVTRPVLTFVSSFDCWGVSIARTGLESVSSLVGWGISLTRPVLVCLLSVCKNFSYSSRDGICRFVRRLGSQAPRAKICLVVRRVGSFSNKSRATNCLVVRRDGSGGWVGWGGG